MSRANTGGGKAGRMEIGAALAGSAAKRESAPASRSGGASRGKGPPPKSGGSSGSREMPARTKTLLGALGAAAILGGVYYGWGMVFGGDVPAAPALAGLDDEMARLRAMELAELKQERKRRDDAVEALLRQASPPPDQLAEAREAVRRATVALHEKQPGSDR